MEIPSGTKSQIIRIPKFVSKSALKVKKEFISGIFDAEASVLKMIDSHHPKGYPRIQFKVVSHAITKDIHDILKLLDINSRIYRYNTFSMIHINGKTQCRLFHDKIGFRHPIKDKRLRALL